MRLIAWLEERVVLKSKEKCVAYSTLQNEDGGVRQQSVNIPKGLIARWKLAALRSSFWHNSKKV